MRAACRARGSQTWASASVTRSTAPPSKKAGNLGSRSGHLQLVFRLPLVFHGFNLVADLWAHSKINVEIKNTIPKALAPTRQQK